MQKAIEADEMLMTVYPKIRGVPEQKKKELYHNELTKIVNENKSIDNARKGVKTLLELNELEEHRQTMHTLKQ